MRVGVVGINHKLADLKLREQLAKAWQKRFGISQSFHEEHHFVFLSTCNRTEIYFSSDDLASTHTYLLSLLRQDLDLEEEFDHKLYSYFGIDCFFHLTRVTAGLDSAIVAETEIQGQVKTAYEFAAEFRVLPKDLHFLFQKSLGIAKKVRSELQLGRGLPSLEHAILNTGYQFFRDLEAARILFVGASEINLKILSFFKTKHLEKITLCNRSDDLAQSIAATQNIDALPWSRLVEWINYDWILFGTKSPDYLIKTEKLKQELDSPKLLIDLSVPRNVAPQISQNKKIHLFNIDQINLLLDRRNSQIKTILNQAEAMILEATHQHTNRYKQKEEAKITLLAVTA